MDHVAINVNDLEWNISFFSEVFGMEIVKEGIADNKKRQVWLSGGIQLVETDEEMSQGVLNHICLVVKDMDGTMEKAEKYGVHHLEKGYNWIVLPTGLCIEVL